MIVTVREMTYARLRETPRGEVSEGGKVVEWIRQSLELSGAS